MDLFVCIINPSRFRNVKWLRKRVLHFRCKQRERVNNGYCMRSYREHWALNSATKLEKCQKVRVIMNADKGELSRRKDELSIRPA